MSPLRSAQERLALVGEAFQGIPSDSRNRANVLAVMEAAFVTHDRGTVELTLREVERVGQHILELQEIVRQNALVAPTESEK